jgi:octaprenyl-diphosphate synthase
MSNFNEIISFYRDDLEKVNQIILDNSIGKSNLILEITQNLINSGGKRIRPLLLIISSNLCGSKKSDFFLNLAAAVEMIHTATLLHDDVVDMSEIRRGKKTANAIWDNKSAILVGDYLFSLSFQLMVKSQNLEVLELLAKTSSIIADGEVLQLQNSHNLNISKEQYFEIIFGKTAVLFSACTEVGALINNLPQPKILAMKNLGKNLGMIFQIIDDILDYSSDQKILGKDIGNDFFEGKVTLPIIETYSQADLQEKKLIEEIFAKNICDNNKNFDDFAKILALINKYHALDNCLKIANELAIQAKNNLKIFEKNIFSLQLEYIIDYSLKRLS